MREIYFPSDQRLKKYIRYILFHVSAEDRKEFLVFPNPGAAIALHKGHSFVTTEKNVYHAVDTHGENFQLLHVNRIDPVKVVHEGIRESITIVFNPLGVNRFISENLADIVATNQGDPSYIDLNKFSFATFCNMVFDHHTTQAKLDAIENYMLQKLKEVNIPFVAEAIESLANLGESASIPAICNNIGTSPRNLARLFNRHILLSPVEFRNVCQFRYSLNKKIEEGEKSLKDIGYESNYSDASYMIRMYKKYTGHNPSTFFDKITVESNFVFLSL